jgi:hypothetical protein
MQKQVNGGLPEYWRATQGCNIANLRTWAQIVANNPDAVIHTTLGAVGINQGSETAG